jgi:hypothetical protein
LFAEQFFQKAHEIRFADDAVLCFQYKQDADKVKEVLPKRFAKYGLTIHPEKTRLLDGEHSAGGHCCEGGRGSDGDSVSEEGRRDHLEFTNRLSAVH